MEGVGSKQVIKASVPYAEVVQYALLLRSLTHGTGTYTMEIGEYAEVPREMSAKIVEAHKEQLENKE
jgi:elongation factor G